MVKLVTKMELQLFFLILSRICPKCYKTNFLGLIHTQIGNFYLILWSHISICSESIFRSLLFIYLCNDHFLNFFCFFESMNSHIALNVITLRAYLMCQTSRNPQQPCIYRLNFMAECLICTQKIIAPSLRPNCFYSLRIVSRSFLQYAFLFFFSFYFLLRPFAGCSIFFLLFKTSELRETDIVFSATFLHSQRAWHLSSALTDGFILIHSGQKSVRNSKRRGGAREEGKSCLEYNGWLMIWSD